MKLSPKHWIAVIALLLFVTWMGARRLNADGVWLDEWWSLYAAGADAFGLPLSPVDIWNRLTTEDPWQLPGFAWTLAAWGNTVGWTEYAARALSLLAGVLAVAVVYRLGREISQQPLVGLGAAVVMGSSTWFIFYLHELRVFTIYVLLTALFFLLYWRIMNRQPPPRARLYAAFALTTAALLYTHPYAVIPIGVTGLWHLARLLWQRPDRRWVLTLACMILAGLPLLPWLDNVQRAVVLTQKVERSKLEGLQILSITGDMFYVFSNTSVALLALLALVSLRERAARGLWLLAGAILALNLVAYQVLKLNEVRYSLNALPLLAVIAGFGLYGLAQRRIHPALIAGLWLAGAVFTDGDWRVDSLIQRYLPQPARETAHILAPYLQADDVVINFLGNKTISIIYAYPFMHYFSELPGRKEIVEIDSLPSLQAYVDRLHEAVGSSPRVWVMYDPHWPSSEWSLFIYLLSQQKIYQCATLADNADLRLLAFGRIDDAAPAARFNGQISARLIGGTPTLQNGMLPVWLGFTVDGNVPPETYSVGLHVVDESGQLRAQADYGLPGAGDNCRMVEIPMESLPSGEYHLQLFVYDWRTGQRLPGVGLDGAPGDSAALAVVAKP